VSAEPLRGPQFRRAAAIQEHLLSLRGGSAERVHEVADDLGELLGSCDVSVAINDPAGGPSGLSLWFREFPAAKLRAIAESTGGHAPFQFIRSRALRTTTFDRIDRGSARVIRSSEFFRRFENESGLHRGLVSHLGTEPGESLGRIVLYRTRDEPDFDEERAALLDILRPAISHAVRGVVSARAAGDRPGTEVALVNAGGQVLWMSEGFRFLWNAADPQRIEYGRLSFETMLSGSDLARSVAIRIMMLAGEPENFRPPRQHVFPFRSGVPGALLASFDPISDRLMGCRGGVLKISLRRRPLVGEPALS
jgi:hypothetical protein